MRRAQLSGNWQFRNASIIILTFSAARIVQQVSEWAGETGDIHTQSIHLLRYCSAIYQSSAKARIVSTVRYLHVVFYACIFISLFKRCQLRCIILQTHRRKSRVLSVANWRRASSAKDPHTVFICLFIYLNQTTWSMLPTYYRKINETDNWTKPNIQ